MPTDDPSAETVAAVAETVADASQPAAPPSGRGAPLGSGAMVGRYRIEARLGAGGMGIVYRARDTELDRAVALKLVRPHGSLEELTERLRRESRLQARAAHHAVITVLDIGRDGDQVYVAMELIEGATLRGWLDGAARPWREILDVFRRAAEGLVAAHAAGLVHRDFKPDNVLVELRDGAVTRVLVTDFGVARAVEDVEGPGGRASAPALGLTATGALVGTPAYMSPEQLHGRPADERADVFSFCVALWEALVGERPFRGGSIAEILAAFDAPPRPPAGARVPRWVVDVLRGGLAIDRAARTPTMARLAAQLDWRQRRRRTVALAGAVVVLAGATAGVVTAMVTREAAVSPCAAPSATGDAIARAGDAVAELLGREAPAHAEHWRASAAGYAGAWRALRARACAAPATAAVQVRCLERLGADVRAWLEAARGADPIRRGDLLRLQVIVAPRECLTAAAADLAALHPDDPRVRAARQAIGEATGAYLRDPAAGRAKLAAAGALVDALGVEALRLELAAAGLDDEADGGEAGAGARALAQAAERAGHRALAAHLWLEASRGLAQETALLTVADQAVTAAGDPARLRAWWHAQRAAADIIERNPAAARQRMQEARAVLAPAGVPFDEQLERALAGLLLRLQDHAAAVPALTRVVAHLDGAGVHARARTSLQARAELAKARYWAGDEATARREVEAMLASDAPGPPLASPELIPVIHLDALIRVWTEPAAALATLERWGPALDAALDRDALWRGHIENVRTLALANLGRFEEAERSGRRALEILVLRLGSSNGNTAELRLLLAQVLLQLGKVLEGEDHLRRGIADLAAFAGDDLPRVAQARLVLATHLLAAQRPAEAIEPAERALAVYATASALPVAERGDLRWTLARALAATTRDAPRERALIEGALADWASDPAYAAERAAARARLRALDRPARR